MSRKGILLDVFIDNIEKNVFAEGEPRNGNPEWVEYFLVSSVVSPTCMGWYGRAVLS